MVELSVSQPHAKTIQESLDAAVTYFRNHLHQMDYADYRELVPDVVFMDIESAADPVAGGINASWGYQSGLMVAVYTLGDGEFILNSLRIRDNLGAVPQADRLLRNMLRFAGRDASKPLAELPADFDAQLGAIGYP